jgi:hypothetical protein
MGNSGRCRAIVTNKKKHEILGFDGGQDLHVGLLG